MKRSILFIGLLALLIGILPPTQATAQSASLSNLVILETSLEDLVNGGEWRGFFRDFRFNDNSWPLKARFIAGDEGELVLVYTFVLEGVEVNGLAHGKIENGAAIFTDGDPSPAFRYVVKHLTRTILVGDIYMDVVNEKGETETRLTGDVFLESSAQ